MSGGPVTESGVFCVMLRSKDEDDPKIARIHRLLLGLYIAVGLNWIQDFWSTIEMLDWLDGRDAGFMSDEFSHDLTVITPFLAMIIVPIVMKWLDVRRRKSNDRS